MENKLNIIEKDIIPHMQEIKKICLMNGIPCFMSVAVGDFEETARKRVEDEVTKKKIVQKKETGKIVTKYISEMVSPTVLGVSLENDRITQMLNVINGFDTVDPNLKFEVDF